MFDQQQSQKRLAVARGRRFAVAAVMPLAALGIAGAAAVQHRSASAMAEAPPDAGVHRSVRVDGASTRPAQWAVRANASPTAPAQAPPTTAPSSTGDIPTRAELEADGWSPTEIEELEEHNAAELAVAMRLSELGIEHWVEVDDEGWVCVDYDDTTATVYIEVERVYRQQWPPSRGEVIDLNDEADALAAHLTQAGIPFTVLTDDFGVRDILPTPEDERAIEALTEFWWVHDPPSPGELQEWNDESNALDRYLTQRGIAHETTTNIHGEVVVTYDEDDPAVEAAVEDFYDEYDPYGWYSDEDDDDSDRDGEGG